MRSWYDIRDAATGDAEILIYDEIGAFGITAKQFADDLKAVGKAARITLRINSPGGSVFDGLAIHNSLKRLSARKTVWIDGIAASIASVIAMAGDEIVMPENAMMMIHDPAGMVAGTAPDMRAMAEALDRIKGGLVAAYRDRTGKADAEVEQLMASETWMTAAEAVAAGFADRVDKPIRATAHFDLSQFRNTPADLATEPPKEEPMSDAAPPAPAPETVPVTELVSAPVSDPAAIEARVRSEALAYAREITDLCALAGEAHKASAFIAAAMPITDVRAALMEARARADEQAVINGTRDARTPKAPPADHGWGPVIARTFPTNLES
ncbi:head maturation protease, ClpP-related [Thalassospira alkalitolerans]|uniref:head maturation protease, ClpP-related n=1 Tax=Thalassospira alkalitolerans TaxID=1293890 RepID=UPI0030EBA746|tara:strand:+ start:27477 stop:28451 length:975 start_codon:yes stop_codon:yes gene_type:complete